MTNQIRFRGGKITLLKSIYTLKDRRIAELSFNKEKRFFISIESSEPSPTGLNIRKRGFEDLKTESPALIYQKRRSLERGLLIKKTTSFKTNKKAPAS